MQCSPLSAVSETGVSCTLMQAFPTPQRPHASPAVTVLSSQTTNSQGSDVTYRPSQTEESERDTEMYDLITLYVLTVYYKGRKFI